MWLTNSTWSAESIFDEKPQNRLEMFLEVTPESEKVIKTLHTLNYFLLCPDGRRFPVEEMCAEYAKKADGIFMRTFGNRLVIVVQAAYPDGTVYWNQAFYLSTGTSIDFLKGRVAANDARAKTWMPFHGLVLNQIDLRAFNYSSKPLNEKIQGGHFYFQKVNHFGWHDFAPKATPKANAEPVGWVALTEEENAFLDFARATGITVGNFLPEGHYRNGHSRLTYLFDRFEVVSYLMASHALGGNAFALKEKIYGSENVRDVDNTSYLPNMAREDFSEKFPELVALIRERKPLQACCEEASSSAEIVKPNMINAFLDHHGAIGRMNLFRSMGMPDIPVPGLAVSSVSVGSLGYSISLEPYENLLIESTSYAYCQFKRGIFTKEQVIEWFSQPLEKLIAIYNLSVDKKYFMMHTPSAITILYGKKTYPLGNFEGGKSTRHKKLQRRRKTHRKMSSKK